MNGPQPVRRYALVPCAGVGSRSGLAGPKQYQPVAGRAVVAHTIAALQAVAGLDGILVVVSPDDAGRFEAAVPGFDPGWLARCGGATRALTVANGLAALADRGASARDWVLVHDAARCLLRPAWVERLMAACEGDAVGGLLALPVADTLKQSRDARVVATIDRADKWAAQTPQMFRLGALGDALAHAGDSVTDEASAIESMGLMPRLVRGDFCNFKLTWPEDFSLAERLLGEPRASLGGHGMG